MMKRDNHPGFTLVEIMIVVAILGLLAAIALPSFVKSRNVAQQNGCISNLRTIEGGKELAALAMKWATGTSPSGFTTTVNTYIKGNSTPECPAGGTYSYNVIGSNAICNIASPTSHRLPIGDGSGGGVSAMSLP